MMDPIERLMIIALCVTLIVGSGLFVVIGWAIVTGNMPK